MVQDQEAHNNPATCTIVVEFEVVSCSRLNYTLTDAICKTTVLIQDHAHKHAIKHIYSTSSNQYLFYL